jgi:hypothetical protein
LLVGVTRDVLAKLDEVINNQIGGYPAISDNHLAKLLSNLPTAVARYEDFRLTNGDEIENWWAGISQEPPDDVVLHITTNVASGEPTRMEVARAVNLNRHLSGQSRPLVQDPIGSAFDQTALVYVIRP